MKSYSLQKMGNIFALSQIRIMKPPQQEVNKDFVSTCPPSCRKQAEQIREEIAKHGYKAYKFISKCTNGLVISVKKGRVRFAIKAKQNFIKVEDEEINLLEKNREFPDNLKFYNHPNILPLFENFETKDYHYTVTEECMCTLKEFVLNINATIREDSKCFEIYAYQLLSALDYLCIGPNNMNSTRYISHIQPSDVLVSYKAQLKLNPNFGCSDTPLGYIPFCHPHLSIYRKSVSCTERFSKSYSHLLLYLNGFTEKQILVSELEESPDYQDRDSEVYKFASRILNKKEDDIDKLSELFDPRGDAGYIRIMLLKLDNLEDTFYQESDGCDIFAVGKGKCISLDQYTKLYELSLEKMTENQNDQMKEFIDEEEARQDQKFSKIKEFVYFIQNDEISRNLKKVFLRNFKNICRDIAQMVKRSLRIKKDLGGKIERNKQKQLRNLERENEKQEDEDQSINSKNLRGKIERNLEREKENQGNEASSMNSVRSSRSNSYENKVQIDAPRVIIRDRTNSREIKRKSTLVRASRSNSREKPTLRTSRSSSREIKRKSSLVRASRSNSREKPTLRTSRSSSRERLQRRIDKDIVKAE